MSHTTDLGYFNFKGCIVSSSSNKGFLLGQKVSSKSELQKVHQSAIKALGKSIDRGLEKINSGKRLELSKQ
jgi:hypothetical protein